MLTNVLLDHGRRYTSIHTASSVSVPSVLPGVSYRSTAVPYQEQSTSRNKFKEFHETRKSPPGAPSRESRSGKGQFSQGRYWCNICGLGCAQQLGIQRYRRDVHEVSMCVYRKDFRWHRRHQLKKHLQGQDPDIDLSPSLRETTRTRRKATMIKNHRKGRRTSPPVEYVLWGRAESLPRRSMMPPLQ